MKTSTIVWVVVVLIIIIGGVWWFMSNGSMMPATTPTTQTQPTGAAVTGTPVSAAPAVMVSTSASLGSFLTGNNGMTLYTYSPDMPGVSNCTGQCSANWPPYTVTPGTALGLPAGASGTLGTISRADGTTQVTYNNAPVYFYIKDTKPGDTVGQGVGGVWYVVKP